MSIQMLVQGPSSEDMAGLVNQSMCACEWVWVGDCVSLLFSKILTCVFSLNLHYNHMQPILLFPFLYIRKLEPLLMVEVEFEFGYEGSSKEL